MYICVCFVCMWMHVSVCVCGVWLWYACASMDVCMCVVYMYAYIYVYVCCICMYAGMYLSVVYVCKCVVCVCMLCEVFSVVCAHFCLWECMPIMYTLGGLLSHFQPYSLETRLLIKSGSRPTARPRDLPISAPLFLSAEVTDICVAMPDFWRGCWVLKSLCYTIQPSAHWAISAACLLMTQQSCVVGSPLPSGGGNT